MTLFPEGWTVSGSIDFNPAAPGFQEGGALLSEDLIQAVSPDGRDVLDVGWLPFMDPSGEFVCSHVLGSWQLLVRECRTRSLAEVEAWLADRVSSIERRAPRNLEVPQDREVGPVGDAREMTSEERLLELLGQKDARIEELERQVAELEHACAADLTWMRHSKSMESEDLPVPRLEIRWTHDADERRWVADYALIHQHFADGRIRIPLGKTTRTGGVDSGPLRHPVLEIPYRDGAHIHHDMLYLNLPGYVVFGSVVRTLERVPPHERT